MSPWVRERYSNEGVRDSSNENGRTSFHRVFFHRNKVGYLFTLPFPKRVRKVNISGGQLVLDECSMGLDVPLDSLHQKTPY